MAEDLTRPLDDTEKALAKKALDSAQAAFVEEALQRRYTNAYGTPSDPDATDLKYKDDYGHKSVLSPDAYKEMKQQMWQSVRQAMDGKPREGAIPLEPSEKISAASWRNKAEIDAHNAILQGRTKEFPEQKALKHDTDNISNKIGDLVTTAMGLPAMPHLNTEDKSTEPTTSDSPNAPAPTLDTKHMTHKQIAELCAAPSKKTGHGGGTGHKNTKPKKEKHIVTHHAAPPAEERPPTPDETVKAAAPVAAPETAHDPKDDIIAGLKEKNAALEAQNDANGKRLDGLEGKLDNFRNNGAQSRGCVAQQQLPPAAAAPARGFIYYRGPDGHIHAQATGGCAQAYAGNRGMPMIQRPAVQFMAPPVVVMERPFISPFMGTGRRGVPVYHGPEFIHHGPGMRGPGMHNR